MNSNQHGNFKRQNFEKELTADFVLFHNWLIAVPDAELKSQKAGDFNGDGALNIADLIRMKGALMK